jgi:hypothetical protein
MSYDERDLGELLRMLPPAPQRLVSLVQELPQHFADEMDAVVGDDHDDDGSDTPTIDHHDDPPPHDIDVDPDQFDDDDSSPDDGWG